MSAYAKNILAIGKIYRLTERAFERVASVAMAVLGNSITFIIALGTVIYWLSNIRYTENNHQAISDIILGFTFLSLFIIQKSFNRFSAALHLKVNELLSSHELASNAVINLNEKTEQEINELSEGYHKRAERPKKKAVAPSTATPPSDRRTPNSFP